MVQLLADRVSDPGLAELLRAELGHRSAKAEVLARSRAEARFASDPAIRRTVTWLLEQIEGTEGVRHRTCRGTVGA